MEPSIPEFNLSWPDLDPNERQVVIMEVARIRKLLPLDKLRAMSPDELAAYRQPMPVADDRVDAVWSAIAIDLGG